MWTFCFEWLGLNNSDKKELDIRDIQRALSSTQISLQECNHPIRSQGSVAHRSYIRDILPWHLYLAPVSCDKYILSCFTCCITQLDVELSPEKPHSQHLATGFLPMPGANRLGEKCAFKTTMLLDWEPQHPESASRTQHVWWLRLTALCPVTRSFHNSSAAPFCILICFISCMVDLIEG